MPVRPDWLALADEPILAPELPIVDPHHHLWDRPGSRYMPAELAADLASGHNFVASVYVECGSGYRDTGPEALRPAGEIEWVGAVADGWAGATDICRGFVGRADLMQGERVESVLQAYLAADPRRMRGVRQNCVGDPDPSLTRPDLACPPDRFAELSFREGFARLAPLGLSFETWLYHPRIDALAALAGAFPDTAIVLDHCGSPIGRGAYRDHPRETFAAWAAAIGRLAERPNVTLKIGGLGMWISGFDFHRAAAPPDSTALAAAWRPYVETCIEAFGAGRCMFESNFPVDKGAYGPAALWNAFKRLTEGASDSEKADLFAGTADRVYRLGLAATGQGVSTATA